MNYTKHTIKILWEGKIYLFLPLVVLTTVLPVYSIYNGTDGEWWLDGVQKIAMYDNTSFIGPIIEKNNDVLLYNTQYIIDNKIDNKMIQINPWIESNQQYGFRIYDWAEYSFDLVTIMVTNMIFGIMIYVLIGLPLKELTQIGNMERQSKRLQKMGIDEFVKQTNAKLIDCSSRGNMLYKSMQIIEHKDTRFLIYKDISTERMYIKYVPSFDPITDRYLGTADEAQAWSLSMSLERYQKMTIEA